MQISKDQKGTADLLPVWFVLVQFIEKQQK